jgi:hypothetical protein
LAAESSSMEVINLSEHQTDRQSAERGRKKNTSEANRWSYFGVKTNFPFVERVNFGFRRFQRGDALTHKSVFLWHTSGDRVDGVCARDPN